MSWTTAVTVDVCKECGSDIEPGDRILRTVYRDLSCGHIVGTRVTYCADCGVLYLDSQELGKDD